MIPAKQQLKDAILRSGLSKRDWYRKVYSRSLHWSNLREMAFLKHGKRCQKCGCGGVLDVHHLNYRSIFDVTVDDLQPICRRCHNIEHGLRARKKKRKTPKIKKMGVIKPNSTWRMAIVDDRIPAHILELLNAKLKSFTAMRPKCARRRAITETINDLNIGGVLEMILESKNPGAKGRKFIRRLEKTESVKSI